MLTIYRRHRKSCAHRTKGRQHRHCQCPIWVGGLLAGKKIRESLRVRNWQKAQETVREWEVEDRRDLRPTRKPLSECWNEFLVDVEARRLHESTIGKYKFLKRQMEDYAKTRQLDFIDEFDLSALGLFRSEWQDGPRTSAKKLERLRAFFEFAQQRKWIPDNPARYLKAPKITLCPTLPYTREEMLRILAATDRYEEEIEESGSRNAQRLPGLVLLLRYTGMRIGDAVRLTADQITGNRLFLYTQKTGVAVNTILPERVLRALEITPKITERHFFWDGKQQLGIAVGSWRRRLAKVFELASVENGHPHRFRDTFAVELLLSGVPIERVSILLGHQSVRVTERHYAPWVRARQEQLEADLNNAWNHDPIINVRSEVHAGDTRGIPRVTDSFYRPNFGGAGGNRTHA
ncbi:MAG TPA: tyrosine-type recombinase/integrase [Terriglobales bacterium]